MSSAGYSGAPLAKKLGFKPGMKVFVANAPANYRALLEPLPEGVSFVTRVGKGADIVHAFFAERRTLEAALPGYMKSVFPDGAIWVSWPKKTAKVATGLTEDVMREVALPLNLVDVKVCAIDDVWSGLKLVIRKAARDK